MVVSMRRRIEQFAGLLLSMLALQSYTTMAVANGVESVEAFVYLVSLSKLLRIFVAG